MIHARCIPTELLLERRAPSLSHAERLRLETHLAECERCRRDHGAMVELLALVQEKVESVVKPSVHERAIARAMSRSRAGSEAGKVARHSSEPRFRPAAMPTFGLAAAAFVALIAVGLSFRTPGAAVESTRSSTVADRVVSGVLSWGDAQLAAGDAVPADRELRPSGAFAVNLAHARLSVKSAESIKWSPNQRVVSLRGAIADVSVDPSRRQAFRVVTPNFSVDVIGTEFRVALDTVSVTEGRVRVLSASGKLLAELGPNQSFTFAPEAEAAPAAATKPPAA